MSEHDKLRAETERLLSIDVPPHIRMVYGDHEAHIRALQSALDRLRAELAERKSVSFGFGDKVVGYGIHDGRPAVFVSPVKGQPGQVGELVGDKEPFHPHSLLDGEWAMTFPSETQMDAVYEALTGERRTQATDELPNPPSPRTAVPDGWQMVPVEPTAEMLHAAAERRYGWEHGGSAGSYDAIAYYNQSVRPCSDYLEHAFRYEWNAALSAAPRQEEAGASGDGREAWRPMTELQKPAGGQWDGITYVAAITEYGNILLATDMGAWNMYQHPDPEEPPLIGWYPLPRGRWWRRTPAAHAVKGGDGNA